MYLSLLLLPMFGSAVAGLLGRKIGVTGAHIITCSCLITSAILAIVAFYEVGLCNSPVSINLISWIDSELMDVSWGFMFDSLTVSMLLPVLVVSSLVHIFSVDYMSADPHNQRFFAYLSMFTFFMLVLVTGDNYLIMFVGWEGIGISSYLLINFWFTRIQANKSAIKALVVNRVGDMFLSIGFFAIFFVFGNLDYSTVFSIAPFINETIITIIGLLLLLAAMGKSAQLGLHTWLPDQPTFHFISKHLFTYQSIITFSNFTPKDEQGPSPTSMTKRRNRSIDNFLFFFLIGLMVSVNLLSRTHKNNTMSRLVYQTATLLEKHDSSWFDYIVTLLGRAKGWDRKENVDSRDNSISVRMTLSTLTYACFINYMLCSFQKGLDHEYLPIPF